MAELRRLETTLHMASEALEQTDGRPCLEAWLAADALAAHELLGLVRLLAAELQEADLVIADSKEELHAALDAAAPWLEEACDDKA